MRTYKVSNRYKSLFKVELYENNLNGKTLVNPDWIPLVFRSDSSARRVVKALINEAQENELSEQSYLLSVDLQPVLIATKETLDMIEKYWVKQSIHIGEVSISNISITEAPNEGVKECIMERIYKCATLL